MGAMHPARPRRLPLSPGWATSTPHQARWSDRMSARALPSMRTCRASEDATAWGDARVRRGPGEARPGQCAGGQQHLVPERLDHQGDLGHGIPGDPSLADGVGEGRPNALPAFGDVEAREGGGGRCPSATSRRPVPTSATRRRRRPRPRRTSARSRRGNPASVNMDAVTGQCPLLPAGQPERQARGGGPRAGACRQGPTGGFHAGQGRGDGHARHGLARHGPSGCPRHPARRCGGTGPGPPPQAWHRRSASPGWGLQRHAQRGAVDEGGVETRPCVVAEQGTTARASLHGTRRPGRAGSRRPRGPGRRGRPPTSGLRCASATLRGLVGVGAVRVEGLGVAAGPSRGTGPGRTSRKVSPATSHSMRSSGSSGS